MCSYLADSHVYPWEGNKKLVLKARESEGPETPEQGPGGEWEGAQAGFLCFHKDLGGGIRALEIWLLFFFKDTFFLLEYVTHILLKTYA